MSDVFDFSFDEIVNEPNDEKTERLVEIKRYEKMYLLKTTNERELTASSLSDSERLSLFNNIVFMGFRRYYIEDLNSRDYTLEGCTPYKINLEGAVIEEASWGDFLCKISSFLLDLDPEKAETITDFRCKWTKTAIFSPIKRTNYKPIKKDLYLNCNHTAVHSCWLLQDLLDYFKIDKASVYFLIHRPCSAEKKELCSYLEQEFKRGFKAYICATYSKEEEYASKVINNIEKYLNPMLANNSKSYPNLFLFDDSLVAYGYICKLKNELYSSLKFDNKAKKVLVKYLEYLYSFYRI